MLTGCATQSTGSPDMVADLAPQAPATFANPAGLHVNPPTPDPRVGLAPGLFDAGEAIWNMRMLSTTPPEEPFVGQTNSDLAFTGNYAIQGNYDGIQVWDISDPANPVSVITYVCPASQSDVSVYDNLLFVSGEGFAGRLDCSGEGVQEAVSHHRLRGIRIFDISDIANPEYVANVQTCRGSHTHTVLKHPGDDDNVYIYVSGSAPVRPAEELAGCSGGMPDEDPNTALFRIEVIRVPLDNPQAAAVVSSPRIFQDLVAPPRHGPGPADIAAAEQAREQALATGGFVIEIQGEVQVLPDQFVTPMLDSIVAARGGEGPPTAADSTALREYVDEMVVQMMGAAGGGDGPAPGPTQCHDITVYPAIGLAGGACVGYGLLLDITDPVNPTRLQAVADSNFAIWHSATFNNDGTAILFTDEWGGGGAPKCRADDPVEWGANAIFTIEDGEMVFQSYYKLPAPQTSLENCVAHNGSLIPIPGRDIMIQGWYQGGISLIDWTDPANPVEIGFHDRGPSNATSQGPGGSWSVYWYNGVIVNSEIARGMDIFELVPSDVLTQNEIDAANSVVLTQLNSQGQPIFEWPATFALARAYLDQLERWHGMTASQIASARAALAAAESASGSARRDGLRSLAATLDGQAAGASDPDRVAKLIDAVQRLADAG
ncbi:MAG: hypothetical protein F4Y24_16645 [Gemmatimonadetes bacterium]|nr:hypothetical protein [Gemmatimonadota bacterium]MYG22167.1 hypothetical protein [Gemmatimonadota bacterium]MYJ37419.1 hypothetical protein [Gemmatimonadota bacterium]